MFNVFLAAVTIIRILTKIFSVDWNTGFYCDPQIWPILHTVLTLFALAYIVYDIIKENKEETILIKKSRSEYILALGIFYFAVKLFIDASMTEVFSVNGLPKFVQLIICGFSIITAVLLLTLKDRRYGFLTVSIWNVAYVIKEFMAYRQVGTASDQLMGILFLCFTTMFWYYLAIGNKKKILIAGWGGLILGVPLLFGNLISFIVYESSYCDFPILSILCIAVWRYIEKTKKYVAISNDI